MVRNFRTALSIVSTSYHHAEYAAKSRPLYDPVFDHPQCNFFSLYQAPIASHPFTVNSWKELGSTFPTSSLQVMIE